MASSSNSFLAEDQTDEDFFNNLVDDEFAVEGSSAGAKEMVRELSNLSLGDVGTSVEDFGDTSDSETKDKQQGGGDLQVSDVPQKDPLVSQENTPNVSLVGGSEEDSSLNMMQAVLSASPTLKTDESKVTSVKQVQWSAFGVSSLQLDTDALETDSDFFGGITDSFANQQKADVDPDFSFVDYDGGAHVGSSELEDQNLYASSSEQNVHQNDAQNLQNLYPGWQYDAVSGQWYQVDSYDTSTVGHLESYSSASTETQERYDNHYQGALTDSSGSDVFCLQQSTPSILETIEEDSALGNVSSWNLGSQESSEYPPNMLGSQESSEYPPNMVFDPQYPGWYYDTNTGLWHTLESYTETTHVSGVLQEEVSKDVTTTVELSQENQNLHNGEISFRDQGNQGFDRDWNVSSVSYTEQGFAAPEEKTIQEQGHQIFGGEWNSASSYAQQGFMVSKEKTIQDPDDQGFTGDMKVSRSIYAQPEYVASEGSLVQNQGNQGFGAGWNASTGNYVESNIWQPEQASKSGILEGFPGNQPVQSFFNSVATGTDQQVSLRTFVPAAKHNFSPNNGFSAAHSFVPTETIHQLNQPNAEQNLHAGLSNSYYESQNNVNYFKQHFHGANDSYSHPHEARSSDGRPSHALVAFGFGGRLIVMKKPSSFGLNLDHGSQGVSGSAISIHNLADVVKDQSNVSSTSDYFDALCRQSYPGPLVGGNAAAKDVHKWIDERIKGCESPGLDFQKSKLLKLLLSLLKISCQHYGKLRSPFGSDPSLEDVDGPDMAVTKLFASAKNITMPYGEYGYGSLTHCMQNLPSEGKLLATAIEAQNLLVSGKRKEALQCAQEGQLWGPALVLAAQLGDKFYVDTVKKMAHHQFMPGSPLRTLCLLIAGQPGDVFSTYNLASSLSHADVASQGPAKVGSNGMLDDWEENLAIITANRTKDDELVMIHLGDCLWKERGEVTAAHTCYLVAEAKFEPHSDSARMCLIGADHWKYPRTYAGPDAIQRTELYEYSKVLGNSQFILLPFQPYKLIYAYMLAEVGKVSDSLRYCQASLKLLKNSGRAPETEVWKSLFSSLEERLRTHQQGGYGTNLAPAKLVGKLFTSIDRSIHRMIGAPPASLPPMPQGSVNDKETYTMAPKVANSQSTMAMPSLISSASVETMSQWTGDSNKKSMHNRSISEPDFGRSPKQNSPKGPGSGAVQSKESRIGRLGSQIFQKTMGWVSRSHRQAKLGEQNKFYYDEKLKRWVEEGTVPPAEETALPPPPTVTPVQNGSMPDFTLNKASDNLSSTPTRAPDSIPSVPLGNNLVNQNQFSARGRMGVRSRYVDTFNKGTSASVSSFQSPAMPSIKPLPSVGANFFVPAAPAVTDEQRADAAEKNNDELTSQEEPSTSATSEASFSSPAPSLSSSMQRYPSMGDIPPFGNKVSPAASSGNGPVPRTRAASWTGTSVDALNAKMTDMKLLNGQQGMNTFIPNAPYPSSDNNSSMELNSSLLVEELHEVQL